ncbi:MAG: 23S rRNA (guanine(2445)-N(2))/(guanine(2069)-N(7))-methyltransferase, partial [Gammaproteobacteria bacterium]|nr:23S rRNA (guanine(2445)-N(2))/(guanine(2069)-N(7))-methyltransferase [Gammaproteobacteria bacterium]
MEDDRHFFATTPLGLEGLLATELAALSAQETREARAGVHFRGSLATAYRACLWSRLANRILLPLARFPAATPDELYAGVRSVDWAEHLRTNGTLAVDFVSSRSSITHELYGAQKVKDAIVDQFQERCGSRPDVRLTEPDIRVNLHLDRDMATLGLDLSGDSLHRRGYRLSGGAAPLKENLAAAMLIRAGWPAMAGEGGVLLDPMCGSGTLPIEAALLAADIAPASLREYFGFLGWEQHQPALWAAFRAEAAERRAAGLDRLPRIVGFDLDRQAVSAAWQNVARMGLQGRVHIERKDFAEARPHAERGLIIVNPPYGERLGEAAELGSLYRQAGRTFREHFQNWRLTMLTGNPELAFQLGIRAQRSYALYNGRIPCRLLNFDIVPERFFTPRERP